MIPMKRRQTVYCFVAVAVVLSFVSVAAYGSMYPPITVKVSSSKSLNVHILNSSVATSTVGTPPSYANTTTYVNESGYYASYLNVTFWVGGYYDAGINAFLIGVVLWIQGHFASNLHLSGLTISLNDYGNPTNSMIQLIPLGAYSYWMNRTFNASFPVPGNQIAGTGSASSHATLRNQYSIFSLDGQAKNSFYNFGTSYSANIAAFVPLSPPFSHVFQIVVTLQGLSRPVSANAFVVFEYGG